MAPPRDRADEAAEDRAGDAPIAPSSAAVPAPPAPPAKSTRRRGRKRKMVGWGTLRLLIITPVVAALALVFIANYRTLGVPHWVIAHVEARLNTQVPEGDRVRLDRLAVGIDLAERALIFDILEARLERTDLEDRVHLPRLSLIMDLAGMLRGRVHFRRLAVDGGVLRLTRNAEGVFDLGFGREAETVARIPASWPEALAALDRVLAHPIAAQLTRVEADSLRVVLADERTGRRLTLSEGAVTLRREGAGAELEIAADLTRGRGGGMPGTFRLALTRIPGNGAELDLRLAGAQTDDLRIVFNAEGPAPVPSPVPGAPAMAPARQVFSALRAGLDMWAVGQLREDGTLAPLEARVALENGILPGWNNAGFDLAALEVVLEPEARRLKVRRAEIRSSHGTVVATGQVLAGKDLSEPLVLQLALSDMGFTGADLLPEPAQFDEGLLEGRLHLAPWRVEIGQAMLAAGPERVRAEGDIWLQGADHIAATLTFGAEDVRAETLKSLWPEGLVPKTRRWIMENLSGGTIRNFAAALRKITPGAPPEVTGSFDFEDTSVRYLRDLPPATNVSGEANFHGTRLSFHVSEATVSSDGHGDIALRGTRFTVPDTRVKPALGVVDLRLDGPVPAVLSVLDNKPFSVLQRANRTPDLLDGRAEVQGTIRVPLVRKVPLEQVDFAFEGEVTGVESTELVRNRRVTSPALALTVRPETVEATGPIMLDGVPLQITWRQPLPRTRDAAPGPGQLSGAVMLSQEALGAFGVDLSAFQLAGRTPAQFEMSLGPDTPRSLTLSSTLEGLSASIPALNWSKPAASAGVLDLVLEPGPAPALPSLTLTAPGLAVEGQVQMREGGALERATLSRVDVGGWLRAAAEISGKGAGQPPQITLTGGNADLRQLDLDTPTSGTGSGAPFSVAVKLDRVTVNDGLSLESVNAYLTGRGGLSGQFTGLLNGGAPVSGTLVPTESGTAVRIRGENAGATLASAGLFRKGQGGTFEMRLLPRPGEGRYDGRLEIENMRVREAPALASLLSALSIVGLLEQMSGDGLYFSTVEADFELRPDSVRILNSAALGPSLGLTADGIYSITDTRLDMQGVVSPFYLVNGLFGGLFARRNEGLIGIQYALRGPPDAPEVQVNPLSILMPGLFREVFRRPAPAPSQ